MENKQKKNLDQLFKETLGNQQAPFEEQDWQSMLAMLENDNEIPVVPLQDKQKQTKTKTNNWLNLKNTIIMTTLALITTLVTLWCSHVNENKVETKSISKQNTVISTENNKQNNNQPNNQNSSAQNWIETPSNHKRSEDKKPAQEASKTSKNPAKSGLTEVPSQIAGANQILASTEQTTEPSSASTGSKNEMATLPEIKKPSDSLLSKAKNQKPFKLIKREVWVDDQYEIIYKKPKNDVEQFWIGMHYTQQQMAQKELWDSMGLKGMSHGFNLQFMSGNILKGDHLAIYGGLDWGMQFYGRGPESEVIINVAAQDKALTHLSSNSMDFLARFHFEYARGPVVPYFNLAGGPRIFMTGQQVETLVTSKTYESSNRHNVLSDVALIGGVGVGAKIKVGPRVSLDARYETFVGSQVDVVDLKHSQFNGTGYTLSKNRVSTDHGQFKVGLIFDLSSEESERRLVKPGHYEERTERIFIDPADSNRVFIPCPCVPCDQDKEDASDKGRTFNIDFPNPSDNPPVRTFPNTNGSGGGTKKPFPGVKQKPVDH